MYSNSSQLYVATSIIFWKNYFRLKENPCCVPTSYGSRSVLLVTDEDNVAIVILNNLVATSCGCRWMPECNIKFYHHLLWIMYICTYLLLHSTYLKILECRTCTQLVFSWMVLVCCMSVHVVTTEVLSPCLINFSP